jgi:hypothetical protein
MSYASLVKMEKKTLDFPHFPTRQQLIVWRNWGLVPVSRIALVLGTTEDNVIELAKGMGMKVPILVDENWLQRGYITIIRANWHLLSYEQLLTLLDWSADKLAHTLKEDDFLDHKLGNFKPDVDEVFYTPLTAAQEERTREIRRILKRHFPADWAEPLEKPFGFLSDFDIEAAKMKASREAEPGEIVLDESWSIVSKVTTKLRLRNLLNSDLPARNRIEICMRIFSVIDEEIEIAKALYDIASRDSRIGYEASNHYFYTLQDLVEKVICCEYVRQEYQKEFGLN